jgi:hypothetical protein
VADAPQRAAVLGDLAELVRRLEALRPTYRRRLGQLRRAGGLQDRVAVLRGLAPAQAERLLGLAVRSADPAVVGSARALARDAANRAPASGGGPLARMERGLREAVWRLLSEEAARKALAGPPYPSNQ